MKKLICFILPICLTCVSTERDSPGKKYFVMEVARPTVNPVPPISAILKFRKFRISPRFETRNLIYRTGDVSFETDFYNELLADPGAMISEAAKRWLQQSGVFKTVVDSSSSLPEDLAVEGNIESLYGDFRDKPTAVLSVQAILIAFEDSEFRVVFQKVYTVSIPLQAKSPEALIHGYDEGLAKLLSELEADFASAARTYITQRKSPQPQAPQG